MHPSPYGYQFDRRGKDSSQSGGKGSKDYGKNSSDSGGKGSKDYGKGRKDRGSISMEVVETMTDRIVELQRTNDRLKLENDRLKEDYRLKDDYSNQRLQAEVNRLQNELVPLESNLQPEVDRLQAEVERLQIDFDCIMAANKRLRQSIAYHVTHLNELAYPHSTLR
jgi:ABC-type phosphate transport system auxiliary subunit